jgi:hypothetical protein
MKRAYISESDPFTSWFNSVYEKSDNLNDILKIKDIFNTYTESYLYENLNKNDKRKMNLTKFRENLNKHPLLKLFCHNRKQINGREYRNILISYKVKDLEDDDDDDNLNNLEFE